MRCSLLPAVRLQLRFWGLTFSPFYCTIGHVHLFHLGGMLYFHFVPARSFWGCLHLVYKRHPWVGKRRLVFDQAAFFCACQPCKNSPSDFPEVNGISAARWAFFPSVNKPEIVNPPPSSNSVGGLLSYLIPRFPGGLPPVSPANATKHRYFVAFAGAFYWTA